jgi:hypothetical protein
VERHEKQLQTYPYHIEVQQCASSQQHSKPDQKSEATVNPKRNAETTLSTPSHKVKFQFTAPYFTYICLQWNPDLMFSFCSACYAIGTIMPFLFQESLKIIYYSYYSNINL